ncbi:MAG: DUF962 domain-containing protein [Bacteroidetes bacterium]|nr:DUF962 domain-containing protein [Bacteroidota bacterium]
MRPLRDWLHEYALSHSNPTNKIVHFICVPLIYFTVMAFLYCVPLYTFSGGFTLTLAHVAFVLISIYYLMLSVPLAIGMILYSIICLLASMGIQAASGGYLGYISLAIFCTAWVFQFWGHGVEGKKPSFFKDLQFLLIGPMWVLKSVLWKVGVNVS